MNLKAVVLLSGLPALLAGAVFAAADGDSITKLKPVGAFDDIKSENERSIALFEEAGKVITHPRCMNCHPATDRPSQGDDRHPHLPLVDRGPDGFGAPGMRCATCHGPTNINYAHLPGHPLWHLAPIEMAWQGKKLGEICVQIKDEKRNGGKNLNQLIEHMAHDSLVGWGWHPDAGREPAPGTQEEFGDLIKAWVATGAICPSP